MRLGISFALAHRAPGEWAERHRELGCSAVAFPVDCHASDAVIDAYADACRDHDLLIAEVGAWCNPLHADPAERAKNRLHCRRQLELADRVGARCCVNVAGTTGEQWDGGYAQNYSDAMFDAVVESVREFVDAARPTRARYALEPMPWMLPDGPDGYLRLLAAVDRPGFGVHLDVVNWINHPRRYFHNAAFIDECFDKLAGRILACHLKDIHLATTLTLHLSEVPCGDGALDLVRYAARAHAADPELPMLIEHLPDEPAYLASFRRMRALFAGAGIPLA